MKKNTVEKYFLGPRQKYTLCLCKKRYVDPLMAINMQHFIVIE